MYSFKICPVSVNTKMRVIKAYVYAHYGVSSTKELRGAIAIEGDLRFKATWLLLADQCTAATKEIPATQKYYTHEGREYPHANRLKELFNNFNAIATNYS